MTATATHAIESFSVLRTSNEANEALETGYLGTTRVRVGHVIRDADQREKIVFFKVDFLPALGFSEKLKRMFLASRAFSLTATAMPFFALSAFGFGQKLAIHPLLAVSALLGVLLLQISVNLYNDFSDYRKLIDVPGSPGGSGVFQAGWYTPAQIRFVARITLASAVLFGIPVLVAYPIPILICGSLGALGALLYSHEKMGLKYHALGDLAVFLLCGPVLTAGFSLATFGEVIPASWVIGGFLGLLACGLLHVNNLHDIDFDRARDANTLAIRLGFRKSQNLLGGLYWIAGLALFASVAFGILPWITLITLGFSWPAIRLLRQVRSALGPSSPQLDGARILAAQIHLISGGLLTLGLLFARWV